MIPSRLETLEPHTMEALTAFTIVLSRSPGHPTLTEYSAIDNERRLSNPDAFIMSI
jgi:hypothetical protein